ncbi:MAG TPA: phosphoglycerate kinase [Myxococcales bacterium]|jgi:phosphoglycerate kinase
MLGSIGDVELTGKRVFVRVDFDVPLDESNDVRDDSLIRAALPTLKLLLSKGARVIVASHLGEPKGRTDPQASLEPAAACLAGLLDKDIRLADDCVGDGVRKLLQEQKNGEVVVLENLRFHRGEESNDPDFARALASLCEVYVDEAFGCSHRALASNVGMVPHVPGPRVAGLRLKKELQILERLVTEPPRPFVAAVGGLKPSDKLRLLESLIPRVDVLLVGGAVAYTFLAARQVSVGKSPTEESKLDAARALLEKAEKAGIKLLLPGDHACLQDEGGKKPGKKVVVDGEAVPEGLCACDIGPKTATSFKVELARARTAFWNGPMGRYEDLRFAEGTRVTGRALGEVKGLSVACGGETAAAVHALRLEKNLGHVSSCGAAALARLSGQALPGVNALEQE